ncbi:MAG TPA: hypothetical protein VLA19_27115 [Herpetosiphonaceae bacterium]|nr:hypothetical protein [Herpetosiphonaceae bacterium]
MKQITSNLRAPALISVLLVLPFMILDWMFKVAPGLHPLRLRHALDFVVLFGLLWLLPTTFLVILMSIVRDVRAGNNLVVHPICLMLSAAVFALIALFWAGLLLDQLPCFLGMPNCDEQELRACAQQASGGLIPKPSYRGCCSSAA